MDSLNNLNRPADAMVFTGPLNIPSEWRTGTIRQTEAVNYFEDEDVTKNQRRSLAQTPVSLPRTAAVATPYLSDQSNETFYNEADYEKITRDLDSRKHSNTLYSKGVISLDDKDDIGSNRTPKKKAERLLRIVQIYFDGADLQRKKSIMTSIVESFNTHQPFLTRYLNLRYLESTANPVREPTLSQELALLQITPGKVACEHNERFNQAVNNRDSFEKDIKYPVQESGR